MRTENTQQPCREWRWWWLRYRRCWRWFLWSWWWRRPWWRWWLMLAPMQIYSLVCLAYFSKWNISISPNWILLFLQIDRTFLIKMIYDGISQCCHFLQCIINDEWGSFFNEKRWDILRYHYKLKIHKILKTPMAITPKRKTICFATLLKQGTDLIWLQKLFNENPLELVCQNHIWSKWLFFSSKADAVFPWEEISSSS